MRMLDVLHTAENRVKTGLSGKVNFEMGLLRAIEAGRVRAIDTVIRDLAKIAKRMPAATEAASGSSPQAVETVSDETASAEPGESVAPEAPPPPDPVPDKKTDTQSSLPGVEELLEKIPRETRKIVEEDFGGKFREVRKIDPTTLL